MTVARTGSHIRFVISDLPDVFQPEAFRADKLGNNDGVLDATIDRVARPMSSEAMESALIGPVFSPQDDLMKPFISDVRSSRAKLRALVHCERPISVVLRQVLASSTIDDRASMIASLVRDPNTAPDARDVAFLLRILSTTPTHQRAPLLSAVERMPSRFGTVLAALLHRSDAIDRFIAQWKDDTLSTPPDVAAPRARDFPWMSVQQWHERRLALAAIPLEQRKQAQVAVMGDSIVQFFDDAAWDERFAHYRGIRLGIGGDKTQQVLYRMQHGELEGLAPRVFMIMVGTNNVDDVSTPTDIARGIAKIVEGAQQRMPNARILVVGLLPRGDQPNTPIRNKIQEVNRELAKLADGQRVSFVDVGNALLNADGSIGVDVLYDMLHPTPKGYRLFCAALAPTLESLTQ